MFGVLVDDDQTSPGFQHAAHLSDRDVDCDGVFQRFRGVDAIERIGGEGKVSHRAGAWGDALRHKVQHGFGEIEGDYGRLGVPVMEDSGEAAFAAAVVQNSAAGLDSEPIQNQLNVINARVNGGREVLFVGGSLIEGTADLAKGSVPFRLRSAEQVFEPGLHAGLDYARVRKMGRPTLLA